MPHCFCLTFFLDSVVRVSSRRADHDIFFLVSDCCFLLRHSELNIIVHVVKSCLLGAVFFLFPTLQLSRGSSRSLQQACMEKRAHLSVPSARGRLRVVAFNFHPIVSHCGRYRARSPFRPSVPPQIPHLCVCYKNLHSLNAPLIFVYLNLQSVHFPHFLLLLSLCLCLSLSCLCFLPVSPMPLPSLLFHR